MNKLNENFIKLQSQFPNLGDYILLSKLVVGRKLSDNVITKLFSKVSKEDYQRSDRDILIQHLVKLTNKKALL